MLLNRGKMSNNEALNIEKPKNFEFLSIAAKRFSLRIRKLSIIENVNEIILL